VKKIYYYWPPAKAGYERHHLKPKHMGGTDADGVVYLTREEHIQAHRDLYEKFGHKGDLWASNLMNGERPKGEDHWMWGRKRPDVVERNKLGNNNANRGKDHYMWGKKQTKESNEKRSKSLTGHTVSQETRKKLSVANGDFLRTQANTKIACDCGCGKSYNQGNLAQHRNGKKYNKEKKQK